MLAAMNNKRYRQAGFNLVEILVALVILSIGLLGLAMLQIESLRHNTDAYLRTQATMLAYDIIDRMRANADAVKNGNYVAAGPPTTEQKCGEDALSHCGSAAALAQYDVWTWYANLAEALPVDAANPSTIEQNGNVITVTIRWNERGLSKERSWAVEL